MSFDASSLAATTAAAAAATTADNTFDYMDIARRLVRADTLSADGTLPAALLPDLPAVDLEPSIRHIDKLLKLLKQYERGKSTTADAAWAFVDKLAESKEINVIHYNLMLKACESSDEIRDLIDVQMRRAGVRPTIFTFTTLVHRLVVEGDIAAARSVAEVVMPAAGVDPSKRIWKTIELSSEFMRTTKFEQLPDMTWKALYLPADEGGEENGASTMSGQELDAPCDIGRAAAIRPGHGSSSCQARRRQLALGRRFRSARRCPRAGGRCARSTNNGELWATAGRW